MLALAEFKTLGIEFVSCQEALDTLTPLGKAMFPIIGAMAEPERNVIRERVVAGMAYARRHGTKSGNAIGRPKRIFDRSEVIRLRASGLAIERTARQMGLGVGTSSGSSRRTSAAPRPSKTHQNRFHKGRCPASTISSVGRSNCRRSGRPVQRHFDRFAPARVPASGCISPTRGSPALSCWSRLVNGNHSCDWS
jgi:hypothetical protein